MTCAERWRERNRIYRGLSSFDLRLLAENGATDEEIRAYEASLRLKFAQAQKKRKERNRKHTQGTDEK